MSQVPFSNPGGNNQTSPSSGIGGVPVKPGIPGTGLGNISGAPGAGQNPYAPVVLGTRPMAAPGAPTAAASSIGMIPLTNAPGGNTGAAGNTSGDQGFITNNSSYSSGQNDLQKQLIDIYGKGVGGSLFALLNNMSGNNSTILQEFIASLQPQMASAQANINASLGAGGVSSNSSVAGIADANLQAQEFAAISGESAKLTQSQEELTANILMGMSDKASKEVSTSAWSTFADVMNNITGDIGNLSGGSYQSPQAQAQANTGGGSGGSMWMGSPDTSAAGSGTSDTLANPSIGEIPTENFVW